jgi:hypothetical protein
MNVLPRDKQVEVVAALTEGYSIRAIERLTSVHRDTIMRLGVRVGNGCAVLHDAMIRGLHVSRIELDEAWSFVAKKQRHLKPSDPADFGDQYVFLALAGSGKANISYRVGKRSGDNCRAFLADLRARVLGAPEISSDAFPAYPDAVERAFGAECRFGTIEKHYAVEPAVEGRAALLTRRRSSGNAATDHRKPGEAFDQLYRAPKSDTQNATASVHPPNQRVLEEVGESRRSGQPVRRPLQFLPGA